MRPDARGLALALLSAAACAPPVRSAPEVTDRWHDQLRSEFRARPDTVPTIWSGLIGEYGPDSASRRFVLERDSALYLLDAQGTYLAIATRRNPAVRAFSPAEPIEEGAVRFSRDASGRSTRLVVGPLSLGRRNIEPPPGATQLRIAPLRPIEELRREALLATPPVESGVFRAPDLVELTSLDSTIRLEIRYATDNNFIGTPVYTQRRAFLQRPAAEALARANRALHSLGYGLLVHDGYRPWYVTKIFWEATPAEHKWLVADPRQGSKHNRGAAVDVTLYVRATGKPVEMPSTYDETSDRARADYPGGTALQRYHRALLRRALEHEGFSVNPTEWWHFDFRDWRSYPLMNVPFESLGRGSP